MERFTNKTEIMKKILEILDKYYGGDYNVDCAKEIHEHYMKFVEWLGKDNNIYYMENKEDLYQHYLDNVLNKMPNDNKRKDC